MKLLLALAAAFVLAPAAWAETASELAEQIRQTELDPQACYRIREVNLYRGEARIYLTDGYLIFGKPIQGRPLSAVFSADVEGGDAEVLLLPPTRAERQSLASFTGSPNLSEHFTSAVLVFSDETYQDLLKIIQSGPSNRKVPEIAPILIERWSSVFRNITSSFETRLVWDLLTAHHEPLGLFAAVFQSS